MLTDLSIKNIAIIDSLTVSFRGGLNILTGETGAGKSIIIDAVNLILGGRGSADLIRAGAEEGVVEAIFDLSGRPSILAELDKIGIECDGELLIKRVVSRSGKNRVFIGGGLSTISILAEISRLLINIYGQHEAQTLLRQENHLLLLDGYGGLLELRREFAALHDEYRQVGGKLKALEEDERDAAHRLDLISFQSDEIANAALIVGEEEELDRERTLLSHGEKLLQNSQEAYAELYGADDAVLGRLAQVKRRLAEMIAIDPALENTLASLDAASIQLEDVALALRTYATRIEADPERLQAVEDRLELIQRLKKKYAPHIPGVLAYKETIDREMEELRSREENRDGLLKRLEDLTDALRVKGEGLYSKRSAAAKLLESAMEKELSELAMKNARFQVAFERLPQAKSTGLERAEFLFSPNPGETPKPLAKIASGGELSRLMLALKQLHPESDVPTLIFDEVDTGIGGATSALVGEKLKRVAAAQQVLCITHLPQVAAYADLHFKVEKKVESGRTITSAVPLANDDRVAEVARMLGGIKITDTTLEHAREMIGEAVR
ncbi:DNA repair ATPase RecN [Geotalea daltonii FRC-32]|uniref:DNA repair protein RecN n=1 Tax=Geotalea daltonii (strain DSM 22248 / JCM 15807 / FRC-32) TaxID=316067 RepID=B9M5P4_GEODF|nr:DNA repair protein RecN [Geotalea daltonii]ACM21803.1 DNA repair ATPase RecN [Geotalea daltonii FRC-32]